MVDVVFAADLPRSAASAAVRDLIVVGKSAAVFI